MEFKDRLKELRIEKGLTIEELAKKLGVSKGLVGMYEKGKRNPSFEMEENIADFFNVDISYLRGLSDYRNAELNPNFKWSPDDLFVLTSIQDNPKFRDLFHKVIQLDESQLDALLAIVYSFKK